MMYKEIKRQSRLFYSEKEYELALSTALKLDTDDLENFLIRESVKGHWFQDFDFCNSVVTNRSLLGQLLNSPRLDELLHKHFQSDWKQIDKQNPIPFQLKIAEQAPELYVKTVRVSQAFLKNGWYAETDLAQNSDYISKHQKVWKHLRGLENKLWNELIVILNESIDENDLSIILANFVLLIEEDHAKNPSNDYLQFLGQVYNTFITTLIGRLPENYKFNGEIKQGLKKVINAQKVSCDIRSLYDRIKKWQVLINSHIDPYCYDLKIEPENEHGIISYNRSSEDYYKWELDGTRYVINRLDYLADSLEVIKQNRDLFKKKLLNKPETKEYELKCQVDYLSLEKFLNDFKLSKFPGGNNLDSERFYQPIIAASNYYKMIYHSFDLLFRQQKNWFLAYQSLKEYNPDLFEMENFPFIFSPVEQLYHKHDTQSKIENDKKTKKAKLSQPFTYKAIPGRSFDRFNINYDVLKRPFLKLGENIFTPTLFFAENDWFYAVTQNALEQLNHRSNNKIRKETSVAMESDLKDLFEKAGFKAELFEGHEFSSAEGDVDIVASDGQDKLLIQLKRTKLRLNLREAYFEYLQTDRKASRQINNVEQHFTTPKGKVFKWIVTTSYENAYKEIDGCVKVNYFDLIIILKSFGLTDNNTSVSSLKDRITSDSQVQDMLKYKAILHPENLDPISFQQYHKDGLFEKLGRFKNQYKIYDDVNLPLPLAEPKEYRVAKFHTDNNSSSYIKMYNKALDADRNGNYSKAKSLLEVFLNQYPNDFDALSAQANVLANMKLFEQAFIYYEKALNIFPEDLMVNRFYYSALYEAKKTNKANEVYEKIQKLYWYVDVQVFPKIKDLPKVIQEKVLSGNF